MIKFRLIRNVRAPVRRAGDAGIDLFVPEYSKDFEDDLKDMNSGRENYISPSRVLVAPHGIIKIPLGVKAKFDDDLAMVIMNRSSVATNRGLDVMACVIDNSYQGEWILSMCNTTDAHASIAYGEKITQSVPLHIDNGDIVIDDCADDDCFFGTKTERGNGGFGSTS